MEKTSTLNLRVNPKIKQEAESILNRLGVPMSAAIDIYLNQIILVGGIPFPVTLPKAPENIDATRMTAEQIHQKIQNGYESYKSGRTMNASEAFEEFRKKHN